MAEERAESQRKKNGSIKFANSQGQILKRDEGVSYLFSFFSIDPNRPPLNLWPNESESVGDYNHRLKAELKKLYIKLLNGEDIILPILAKESGEVKQSADYIKESTILRNKFNEDGSFYTFYSEDLQNLCIFNEVLSHQSLEEAASSITNPRSKEILGEALKELKKGGVSPSLPVEEKMVVELKSTNPILAAINKTKFEKLISDKHFKIAKETPTGAILCSENDENKQIKLIKDPSGRLIATTTDTSDEVMAMMATTLFQALGLNGKVMININPPDSPDAEKIRKALWIEARKNGLEVKDFNPTDKDTVSRGDEGYKQAVAENKRVEQTMSDVFDESKNEDIPDEVRLTERRKMIGPD